MNVISDSAHPRTIKLVGTKQFEVEMLQMPDDTFAIRYHRRANVSHDYVENIQHYLSAFIVFEQKLLEMEGN